VVPYFNDRGCEPAHSLSRYSTALPNPRVAGCGRHCAPRSGTMGGLCRTGSRISGRQQIDPAVQACQAANPKLVQKPQRVAVRQRNSHRLMTAAFRHPVAKR
jgi:hypothetical protein